MEFEDLMNKTIHCSLLIYPPDVNPCILTEGFDCERPGYEMELLSLVSKKFNWNFTFSIPKDLQFGGFVNGSWNGIIAQLLNNETTLSCKQLTFTQIRSTVVDFTYPIKYVKQGFLIRNPGAKASEFQFSKVLHWDFYAIILSIFVAAIIVAFLDIRVRKLQGRRTKSLIHMLYDFSTGGTSSDHDETLGSRIFSSTTLMMFGIIYTYFFTHLLQASIIVTNTIPFRNAKELATLIASDNYRIVADSLSTAWYVEVFNSKMDTFRSLKNVLQVVPPVMELNQTKILQMIFDNEKKNYVYSHNLDILKNLVQSRCDKYLIIEDNTPYLSFSSYVFPRGSVYNKAFAWALMDMHEWAEKTLKSRYYPVAPCDEITNGMNDYNVIQAIIVKTVLYFGAFLSFSLLAFVCEYAYRYRGKIVTIMKCQHVVQPMQTLSPEDEN